MLINILINYVLDVLICIRLCSQMLFTAGEVEGTFTVKLNSVQLLGR